VLSGRILSAETDRIVKMLVGKFLPLVIFSSLLVTALGAEVKREKREATLDLIGGLASPFINFKRGLINLLSGSKAEKKPAKPAQRPSYGAPAPSYNAPAPSYNAPAPSYHEPAPAPSYQAPVPAPSYQAPAPVYDPPAPKPEIQILPAPDLSQYAPAPAVDSYGSPAAAPAVDTYGSPAAAPAVDSYGSPVIPTYVVEPEAPALPALAPVYEPAPAPALPADPPVYEPATYEPAPVDNVPAVKEIVTDAPTVADVIVPKAIAAVVDTVDLKSAELPAEPREPKAFNDEQPKINQLQVVDEKPAEEIIIDLTDAVENVIITTEEDFQTSFAQESNEEKNEALVIDEVDTDKPAVSKIITFEAVEEIPAISGPVQSSNEVISFSPSQDAQVRIIDFTAVQSEPQIDTFTAVPIVVNLVQDTTTAVPVVVNLVQDTTTAVNTVQDTTTAATTVQEALPIENVTPIVPNQELRSLVVELDSSPLEVAEIEVVDDDVEVIDLRTNKQSSDLTLIDHDEDHPELFVLVDETTTAAVAVTAQPLQEEELAVDVDDNTIESDDYIQLENEVETEQSLNEIESPKEPELRQVTFKILSDEEAKNVNPEITFRIVDAADQVEQDNFDTFRVLETTTAPEDIPTAGISAGVGTNPGEIPPVIGSDPVFQEIVNTAEASDQVKRGYNAYDPRHSQVYAHKYNDKYSNWYYFRKGY